ncbi:hypothetical protein TNCV_4036611 [Trichonephila clavipes]|nr:hypothetical protein TNCV_4036611 [Trichonephila clavipes]
MEESSKEGTGSRGAVLRDMLMMTGDMRADARLPLLRSQRILSSSDVPFFVSPFPRRGHCLLWGDAKRACNSAFTSQSAILKMS